MKLTNLSSTYEVLLDEDESDSKKFINEIKSLSEHLNNFADYVDFEDNVRNANVTLSITHGLKC